jgi:hypothetical protein
LRHSAELEPKRKFRTRGAALASSTSLSGWSDTPHAWNRWGLSSRLGLQSRWSWNILLGKSKIENRRKSWLQWPSALTTLTIEHWDRIFSCRRGSTGFIERDNSLREWGLQGTLDYWRLTMDDWRLTIDFAPGNLPIRGRNRKFGWINRPE